MILSESCSVSARRSRPFETLFVVCLACVCALFCVEMALIMFVSDGDGSLTVSKQDPFSVKAPPRAPRASPASFDYTQTCTAEQLTTIQTQLPPDECRINHSWTTMCSFSYASCCPQAVWLEDLYNNYNKNNNEASVLQQQTAVYVGCNKALDAVNTLRMLSNDAKYDKTVWRKALFGNDEIPTGSCGQERDDQYPIIDNNNIYNNNNAPVRQAFVHCIEALPANAQRLQQTAQALNWQNALLVQNVAIGEADAAPNATMLFPDATHPLLKKRKFGVETAFAGNCQGKRGVQHCTPVPVVSLDTYLAQHVGNKNNDSSSSNAMIDFLSIDIEGLDWTVLQGAKLLSTRVRYLEFEYNHKGPWGQQHLRDAINHLQQAGFVCYWPGVGGNIWRITGCWLQHYEFHFWSNVACGNTALGVPVLQRMEARFHETLAAGNQIQYNHLSTAKTDGRNFPLVPTYPPEVKK